MALNIGKALEAFKMADFVDLDCGSWDLRIAPAAVHNEEFRAEVTKRAMVSKKKSLVPDKGSITGSMEDDVELFLAVVVQGWGERPLTDDDGQVVEYTVDVGRELFLGSAEGKVLFGKVMKAAVDDEMFKLSETQLGNS